MTPPMIPDAMRTSRFCSASRSERDLYFRASGSRLAGTGSPVVLLFVLAMRQFFSSKTKRRSAIIPDCRPHTKFILHVLPGSQPYCTALVAAHVICREGQQR